MRDNSSGGQEVSAQEKRLTLLSDDHRKSKVLSVLLMEEGGICLDALNKSLQKTPSVSLKISPVPSLSAALESLSNEEFDAVILNTQRLTDSRGIEAFLWVRNQAPEMPIIGVNPRNNQELAVELLRNGAQDFFPEEELAEGFPLRAIHYAIERQLVAQQESERRTRLILDRSYNPFIAIDAEGYVTDWNAQAEATFGWQRNEAVGKKLADLIIPPEHHHAHEEGLRKFLQEGEGHFLNKYIELEGVHRDGHRIPVEMVMFPVQWGDTFLFCAFMRDITERQQINRQRDEFVATLAHDLKIPLLGANRMLDFLGESLNEAQRDLIKKLRASNERVLDLIKRLLEVYRYEQGKKELYYDRCDLDSIIKQTISEMRPQLDAGSLQVDYKTTNKIPLIIGDPGELRRLFTNLLDNAIKFSPPSAVINIRAAREEDEVRIELEDKGIGIAREDIPKLFQRFWQSEPGRKYAAGTGLGLFLCRQIAEAHGGRILCSSSEGSGALFTVVLPVVAKPLH
jgi:PAS domain S-box-containing protein